MCWRKAERWSSADVMKEIDHEAAGRRVRSLSDAYVPVRSKACALTHCSRRSVADVVDIAGHHRTIPVLSRPASPEAIRQPAGRVSMSEPSSVIARDEQWRTAKSGRGPKRPRSNRG